MKKKLVLTNILIVFLALVLTLLTSSVINYQSDKAAYEQRAKDYLSFTSAVFDGNNLEETERAIEKTSAEIYLTILTLEGEVLLDLSGGDATENFLERPELQKEALGQVFTRYSSSSQKMMMYVAGLDDNHYLLIAIPFFKVSAAMRTLLLWGGITFILIGTMSTLLIMFFAKRGLAPINAALNQFAHLLDDQVKTTSDLDDIPQILSDFSAELNEKIKLISEKNEEITTVFNTLTQGVTLLDQEGNIILINEQMHGFFHLKEAEVLNKHYTRMIRNLELQKLIAQALKTRKNQQYLHVSEGQAIKCLINTIDTSWLSGGVIITFEDVTSEENIAKTKKDFFQNASHELKSPLTSIIGYQQMITSGIVEDLPAIKEYSFKTLNEAQRMNNILIDMLDLSALEQGYQKKEERVELDLLIQEITHSLKERMASKNLTLTLELEKTEILGEEKLLDELIRNLIDNAIKYNQDDGKIDISLKNKRLIVSDTGIGIADEDKSRVFERFYRADKGRSKAQGGTGLGLAIVKHICEIYDYQLTLVSYLGLGTRITVDFKQMKKGNL
ncbi:MAG: ATP-binding protein [Bacilli bacterium]